MGAMMARKIPGRPWQWVSCLRSCSCCCGVSHPAFRFGFRSWCGPTSGDGRLVDGRLGINLGPMVQARMKTGSSWRAC